MVNRVTGPVPAPLVVDVAGFVLLPPQPASIKKPVNAGTSNHRRIASPQKQKEEVNHIADMECRW
jgi:hypothetical protein